MPRQLFSNATVLWEEAEIEERDSLIRVIASLLKTAWTTLNPAISFHRVETPILTPPEEMAGHIAARFELLKTARGYLRPETTAGTFAALPLLYPQASQLRKRLPICLWQAGKSFRDEATGQTMRASKLRLLEFWQQEFQLFASADSKADYLGVAMNALISHFGGCQVLIGDAALPHYSRSTRDWEINGLEVASLSERNDWPQGTVYEVAIGLDRLVATPRHYVDHLA